MPLHPLAGKPAPRELLIDVAKLEAAYYERRPDLADPSQRVAFGKWRDEFCRQLREGFTRMQ